MSTTIRFATADDAVTIHRFIRELAAYENEPDAVEATPESLRAQMSEARPAFECLLAESSGIPVGFALFFQTYSTWRGAPGIWLEDLFVPPERRGAGIGKALLRGLAAIAVERGCRRLEWMVLDWNTSAIGFYRETGAVALDGWTVFRLTGAGLGRFAAPP